MRFSIWCLGFLSLALASRPGMAAPPLRPIAGSAPSILAGLLDQWRTAARDGGLDVRIDPPYGPPQGVLDPKLEAVLKGHGEVAFLTREIAERDLTTYRTHHAGRTPLIIPVAGGNWNRFGYVDPVVVIVHRDNPIAKLTFAELDALLSTTRWRRHARVRRWRDLGVGGVLADKEIMVAGGEAWRGEESARALTIRRTVLSRPGRVGRWRAIDGSGTEAEVVARVSANPDAIGFTGAGHIASGVRTVPIARDDHPAVALDRETATSGVYPLLRTVDLLIPTDADGQPPAAALALARLLLSARGQAIAAAQGDFMPLPPPALARARQAIALFASRIERRAWFKSRYSPRRR